MFKLIKDINNWIYFIKAINKLKKVYGWETFKVKQDYFGRLYFVINIDDIVVFTVQDETNKINELSQRNITFNSQIKPLSTFISANNPLLADMLRVSHKDINQNSRLYILEPTLNILNFETIKKIIYLLFIIATLDFTLFMLKGKFLIFNFLIGVFKYGYTFLSETLSKLFDYIIKILEFNG